MVKTKCTHDALNGQYTLKSADVQTEANRLKGIPDVECLPVRIWPHSLINIKYYERANYYYHSAELRSIVADEVAAILPKLADFRRKNEPVEIDNLSVEEAVRFIAEQGIPTTRSTIYNWVFLKKIPFKKIGRRTVFSKKELLAWIESRTTLPEDRRAVAAARIAKSANCK